MRTLTILLSAFDLLPFVMQAQITLEHTYVGGSSMGLAPPTNDQQPLMVQLEVDGYKYVIIDRVSKVAEFYHLDHTPFRSVSSAAATVINPGFPIIDILYISQHLFDLDDEIEFMFSSRYYDPMTRVPNDHPDRE